ncbi:hypothetical protein FRC12_023323 [Ceratobasidium sp. 428]|nr:hypothetical protein FRC12_023323 [Ceratobasidium sp. 428]
MWLQYCLADIGFPSRTPIPIRCDNNGAITITKNPAEHQRTKHMHRKYHYIRERAAADDISLERCDTNSQLADYLTKPVPRDTFTQCIAGIGVGSPKSSDNGGSADEDPADAAGLGGSVRSGPVSDHAARQAPSPQATAHV